MTINILSTPQIVSNYAAAVQAKTSKAISFVVGSLELSRANAVAGVMMWLQAFGMQILALTRAATSSGIDVDTWLADFNIVLREAAVSSQGTVTFSRYTATAQVTIAPGTLVQTADGTEQFTVIADTSQTAWNATLNAYVLGAGINTINATVQAVNAGTQGNVAAGTITQIASAVSVDTVTNASPFVNGLDAELDAALMVRFQLTLQALRSGIKAAAGAAITSLQQNIQYAIVENQTFAGATQNGFFYVVISPFNTTLQALVYSAVDAIRPLSSTFAVYAANTLAANVAVTVTAQAGYTHAQVAASVTTAVQNFIAAIPLGSGVSWSQLYAVVWAVPGVADATSLTLNTGTADLAAVNNQQITSGTVTVS